MRTAGSRLKNSKLNAMPGNTSLAATRLDLGNPSLMHPNLEGGLVGSRLQRLRNAAHLRTKKPRDLADAPEASEYNHVDEPAKSLFKPCTKLPDQVLHTQVPSFVLPSH